MRLRTFRRWWIMVILCALAVAGVGAWLGLRNRAGRVLTAGAEQSPPYTSWSSDGQVHGYVAEIVEEAARRRGYAVNWVRMGEDGGCDAAIRAERVDLCPAVGVLESRTRDFHISRPWVRNSFNLLTDLRKPLRGDAASSGMTLSLVDDEGTKQHASQLFPHMRHLVEDSQVGAVQALCRGKSAAALVETRLLEQILLRRPPGCDGVEFQNQVLPNASVEFGIGGPRVNAKLLDELRDEIDDLHVNGFFARAVEPWEPFGVTGTGFLFQQQEARWRIWLISLSALAAGLLALVLVVFNRRMAAVRRVAVQAAAEKSEFIAHLSHEFRTPLGGVLSTTELLLERPLDGDARHYVEIIRDSGRMLLQLVSDLLDLKQIEAGRLDLNLEPCQLKVLLAGVLDSVRDDAAHRGVGLWLNIAPDVPDLVICDTVRLRQVVYKLTSNAVKFTESGEVRLGAAWQDGLRLEVQDTGIGIPPETLDQLFDKFVQADSSITKLFGGTGLGLALTKALVELMGGRIGVASVLGSGTRFWMEVPLATCETVKTEPAEIPIREPEETSPSILLVEDNKTNQFIVRRLLEWTGCQVDVVANGEEAVQQVFRCHYDAVFMDCFMPVLDGYEATRIIRNSSGVERLVPIIGLSAAALDSDRQRALDAGMNDYVTKPVSRDVLMRKVARWASVRK